jgi:Na+/H+-dicarboxylate symporter
VIAALASESRSNVAGRLGARAIALFVAMLAGVAVLGIVVGPIVMGWLHIDPSSAASLRASASSAPQPTLPGFSSWLVALVPANPIKAAADGAMLPMIVFAVVFGVALSRLAPAVRIPRRPCSAGSPTRCSFSSSGCWRSRRSACSCWRWDSLCISGRTLPALLRSSSWRTGAVLVVIGALLYVAARVGGGVRWSEFARATLPAQIVALSTRSSVAALPAMIDGAQRVLRIPPEIVGVALPLGVSLFRVNTPASWIISGLFIGKLYGVSLSLGAVATIGIAAIPMSLSVPGIPSGGLFILAPLFVAVGLPSRASHSLSHSTRFRMCSRRW